MKKFSRRLTSVFLAVIMLLTTFPLSTGLFTVTATNNYYVGDIVNFGSYPQSNSQFAALDWSKPSARATVQANVATISLEEIPIIDEGHYTGNMGDSRIFNLNRSGLIGYDGRYYRNGNTALDGTICNNGFEAWIARWNFGDNISWAYATFDTGGRYKTLTGKTNLIRGSYNTSSFDTTVYFLDGETVLASYRLTNTDYIKDICVDVSNVKELKLLVKDNVKAAGGTSFALYDLFLDILIDSDGDGLYDEWEINGIDTNGDGKPEVDLKAMGADPKVPDVFVEVDWMVRPKKKILFWETQSTRNLKPSQNSLRLVYNAFKEHGINLHIDAGSDTTDFVTGKKWGGTIWWK